MFSFLKLTLPVTTEQQQWVDTSFVRLASILGRDRLLKAPVVLPTPAFFPDPFDNSEIALKAMLGRVAKLMQINSAIDVLLIPSDAETIRGLVPFSSGRTSEAAGLYFHEVADVPQIAINETQLKNPMALVAVLAHELSHVMLLGPELIDRDEPDMEPLTDLLTVFLGLGIFTANSAFRFEQHQSDLTYGWSTKRLGYLSEEMFAYALARFAMERGERKPAWASFLSVNAAAYFKRSAAWLSANSRPLLSE